MFVTISGVVKNGVVIPTAPLPEGAQVEIRIPPVASTIPPELQEEIDAWDRCSAESLELVERLARESHSDDQG